MDLFGSVRFFRFWAYWAYFEFLNCQPIRTHECNNLIQQLIYPNFITNINNKYKVFKTYFITNILLTTNKVLTKYEILRFQNT